MNHVLISSSLLMMLQNSDKKKYSKSLEAPRRGPSSKVKLFLN